MTATRKRTGTAKAARGKADAAESSGSAAPAPEAKTEEAAGTSAPAPEIKTEEAAGASAPDPEAKSEGPVGSSEPNTDPQPAEKPSDKVAVILTAPMFDHELGRPFKVREEYECTPDEAKRMIAGGVAKAKE